MFSQSKSCELQATSVGARQGSYSISSRDARSADHIHSFRDEVRKIGPVRFIRLNIYPDGGVSRLRMIGTVAASGS